MLASRPRRASWSLCARGHALSGKAPCPLAPDSCYFRTRNIQRDPVPRGAALRHLLTPPDARRASRNCLHPPRREVVCPGRER